MRQNNYNQEQIEELLKCRLQQEQEAGIPSIPENLKPEHMEELLEMQIKKSVRKPALVRYAWTGGLTTVVAAAAVIFLILPILGSGGFSKDMAAAESCNENISVSDVMAETTAAASCFVSTEEQADEKLQTEMAAGITADMGGQESGVTEALETEILGELQIEGSYQTACLEEDILYLLQKTEVYEVYQISLANPQEDWERYTLLLSAEEEIVKLYAKNQVLYIETAKGTIEEIELRR